MNSKTLRLFLSALLVFALVPTAAFADDVTEEGASAEGANATNNAAVDDTFGGFADEGFGGFGEDESLTPEVEDDVAAGDSWRITDGVPNSVWLEENEDAGIMPLGAFSDVGDEYRATWSVVNGLNTYTDRKNPNKMGTIISVPAALEVGVDISYFNNEKGGTYRAIDWNQVKADGITFAIIRLGDGGTNGKGFNDPWFVRNIQGAKKAGLKVGVYLFSRATNLKDTGDFSVGNEIRQTRNQLAAAGIGPDDLELPVYLDLECQAQRNLAKTKKGAQTLGQIATKYCEALQADGYKVGIYANTDWFKNVLTDSVFSKETMAANQWSRWVARYSWGGTSSLIDNTDIWQFTSVGTVNGTPRKYCDVNFAYLNFGSAPKVYTAQYQLNGGAMEAANPVSYVSSLKLPTPTRTHYQFDGWYTDKGFKNKVTTLSKTNATLYAKWSQPYRVTYKLNKGKNSKSNLSKFGGTLALKNPTRSGYTFAGWYTDSKFKNKVTKLTSKNMKNNKVTVYAKWLKNYKVTYKLNGGKNSKSNPSKAAGTLTLKNPTRSGYVFKGWYTDKKFKKKVTKLSMTKNRTVYAKWAKLKGRYYRVTAKSGLYIRKSASTSSPITGALGYNKKVLVKSTKNGWGKLSDGRGWIKLSYARKV